MWLLYSRAADPSRVYYGTDTRAQPPADGDPARARRGRRSSGSGAPLLPLELPGCAALAGAVILFYTIDDFSPTIYRGGDLAAAFCFAVLIAAAAHPASRLGRVVGWPPLRWVGERSYGIYLWHLPILELTRPGVDVRWTGPGLVVAQAALVVLAAALSYRFVEQPIRTGRLQRWLAAWPKRRLFALGVTAALAAGFGALFATPAPASSVASEFPVQTVALHLGHVPRNLDPPPPPPPPLQPLPPRALLAIGDSVMLGCSDALRADSTAASLSTRWSGARSRTPSRGSSTTATARPGCRPP